MIWSMEILLLLCKLWVTQVACRNWSLLIMLQIEQLEQEVADLHQALADKKEQEAAVLKVQVCLFFL